MDHISHKMISKLLIMQKANEKIQKQTSQINRLEGRVQQLEGRVQQLEGDNQLLQQRVQQLEGDNQLLQQRVQQLEGQLNSSHRNNLNLFACKNFLCWAFIMFILFTILVGLFKIKPSRI